MFLKLERPETDDYWVCHKQVFGCEGKILIRNINISRNNELMFKRVSRPLQKKIWKCLCIFLRFRTFRAFFFPKKTYILLADSLFLIYKIESIILFLIDICIFSLIFHLFDWRFIWIFQVLGQSKLYILECFLIIYQYIFKKQFFHSIVKLTHKHLNSNNNKKWRRLW